MSASLPLIQRDSRFAEIAAMALPCAQCRDRQNDMGRCTPDSGHELNVREGRWQRPRILENEMVWRQPFDLFQPLVLFRRDTDKLPLINDVGAGDAGNACRCN